jgi:hypothetical protein
VVAFVTSAVGERDDAGTGRAEHDHDRSGDQDAVAGAQPAARPTRTGAVGAFGRDGGAQLRAMPLGGVTGRLGRR